MKKFEESGKYRENEISWFLLGAIGKTNEKQKPEVFLTSRYIKRLSFPAMRGQKIAENKM